MKYNGLEEDYLTKSALYLRIEAIDKSPKEMNKIQDRNSSDRSLFWRLLWEGDHYLIGYDVLVKKS